MGKESDLEGLNHGAESMRKQIAVRWKNRLVKKLVLAWPHGRGKIMVVTPSLIQGQNGVYGCIRRRSVNFRNGKQYFKDALGGGIDSMVAGERGG